MKFGYFTLRDHLHEKNLPSTMMFAADIIEEAVSAETIGRHSAWIGEHGLSTLGVLSFPLSGA